VLIVTYVLNLVLVEVRHTVDDHPWDGAAEVNNLVHEEGHDTGGQNIVSDEGVPGSPETFKVVELNVVF